ncbi:MAG: hypothetical protein PHX83_15745 [Acidobacteriia bacterium]|nr:hypothetical protein [Terriglobia bacterium]
MRYLKRFLAGSLLACTLFFVLPGRKVAAEPEGLKDPAVLKLLQDGMDALFNLDYVRAWGDFQKVKQLRPDTPLGMIFQSEWLWWRIFNATGDYYNLDYIDALKTKTSPFDDQFINSMEMAFGECDTYLKNHPNDPEAYFHLGMSNALRSRLEAGRDHTLSVIKYVKRSHDYLEQCLRLDPNFKDAYLGLGAYNFYVEEYGGIYKPLRMLIRLPAGDRNTGIRQLEEAAALNNFTSTEAKFFLVSIFLRDSSQRYAEAERMLEELSGKYPNNPIFRFALANSQKLQHKNAMAKMNFQKVIQNPQSPHVGDILELARKEVATLK